MCPHPRAGIQAAQGMEAKAFLFLDLYLFVEKYLFTQGFSLSWKFMQIFSPPNKYMQKKRKNLAK
jgi:hypothetical protein